MANISHIKQYGDQLIVVFDDGTQKVSYQSGPSTWAVRKTGGGGTVTVTPATYIGMGKWQAYTALVNLGLQVTFSQGQAAADAAHVDIVYDVQPSGTINVGSTVTLYTYGPVAVGIYNPWAGYGISSGGDWADHGSYSLGGVDYPLPYGTPLAAPTAGTLQTTGGSGEWAAGWVGTAGRRSILHLDQAYPRLHGFSPSSGSAIDHEGDLVAIVLQHQSEFGISGGHYNLGEICGVSGASASGSNWGGQVHLHVHGLNASGQRMDFTRFVP